MQLLASKRKPKTKRGRGCDQCPSFFPCHVRQKTLTAALLSSLLPTLWREASLLASATMTSTVCANCSQALACSSKDADVDECTCVDMCIFVCICACLCSQNLYLNFLVSACGVQWMHLDNVCLHMHVIVGLPMQPKKSSCPSK